MNNPSTSLPFDLILIIISKADFETLLRCRHVCKSWRAALSEAAMLQSPSTQQSSRYLLFHSFTHNSDKRVIHLYSTRTIPSRENAILKLSATVKPTARAGTIKLVGSCNGMLCSYHREHHDEKGFFLVSNPMTSEHVTITQEAPHLGPIGFGFSPSTSEYKLVRLFPKEIHELEAKVLTLGPSGNEGMSLWRSVACPFRILLYALKDEFRFGVFLKKSIYWLVCCNGFKILVFDLENERFSTMVLPPDPDDQKSKYTTPLAVIKGCLVVCKNVKYIARHRCRRKWVEEVIGRGQQIWALKEDEIQNSWVLIREIRNRWVCTYESSYYWRITREDVLLMLYKNGKNRERTLFMRREGGYAKLYLLDDKDENGDFSLVDLPFPDFDAIVEYTPTFLSLHQLLKGSNI